MPLVDPRSVTTIPLAETSIRAWCLEMSGSSRTRVLSGARPMVPEEVMRKDLSVCLEEGNAPELAEADDGAACGLPEADVGGGRGRRAHCRRHGAGLRGDGGGRRQTRG